MLIYVAGPYRAKTESEVYENIQNAREMSKQLWKKGHVPIVPHMNSAFMGGVVSDKAFIDGGLEILRAVAVTNGGIIFIGEWLDSEGSNIEYEEALKLKMKIFIEIEEIPK